MISHLDLIADLKQQTARDDAAHLAEQLAREVSS